jgi:hypothetical protein
MEVLAFKLICSLFDKRHPALCEWRHLHLLVSMPARCSFS